MNFITLDPRIRAHLPSGALVAVVLKKDQRKGTLTEGYILEVLTSSPFHPRGIKVRLADGKVGRVQKILGVPAERVPARWHI